MSTPLPKNVELDENERQEHDDAPRFVMLGAGEGDACTAEGVCAS